MTRSADRLANCVCALLLAAISSAVLAGWVFQVPLLMRVSSSFAPTQFNTALCFLLYSAGLVSSGRSGRRFSRLVAAAICLTGTISIAQSFLGHSLGIDTVFGFYIRAGHSAAVSRMADATAVALIAIGAALRLGTEDAGKSRSLGGAVAVAGSVVLAVAIGALLGYGARLQSVAGWIGFTEIGVPTACLCLFAGAHILWIAWRRFDNREMWLPIPVFVGLLTILLTVTQELRDDQAASFDARIQASAQQFADRAHASLADMFGAFDGMADRWNIAEENSRPMWESDVWAYLRSYRGLAAMEWVDAQGRLRWALPAGANAAILERTLRAEFPDAKAMGSAPKITRMTRLAHGAPGFLYMEPLRSGGRHDGFLIAVVRADDLVAGVFGPADTGQFAIIVNADGIRISSMPQAAPYAPEWIRTVDLSIRNAHWLLSVSPRPQLLSRSLSSIPDVFFGVGLLIVFLLTFNAYLLPRWRRNVQTLQEKEEELRRNDERYELAVKGAGVGLWDYNLVSGQLYWSPRYREILGIADPAFVPPRTEFESRVHGDDKARIFAGIARAIDGGVAYDGEARVRRDDGTYVWLRLRGIPFRDRSGKLVRLSGSIDDITPLKQAEDALRASEETFRVTMDSAPVGIALLSPDARLLRANPAMARIVGCTEGELLAVDPGEVIPSVFEEDRVQICRLVAGEIDHYQLEHVLVRRDGTPVWVLVNASLARNSDGSPRHIVKQVMDVSERKEMDRMKSEFISVVSHELRTPLTAIRGSLGLLATAMSSALPEKALQLVQIGYRNSERLITLVNDILDMEKLAADRMPFEPRREDLNALVRQAIESNAAYAQKYDVTFVLSAGEGDFNVVVDQNRLGQVFANIFSNAAKYSPEFGRVDVSTRRLVDRARMEVRDYGPGIAAEFRPRIFGRFMQADSSITRQKGGTGLGLHISKELVERMGGWIGFESVAGQGAMFWIEFPLAARFGKSHLPPDQAFIPAAPRILVCDDDPDAVEFIGGALARCGCEVDVARDLASARARLTHHEYAAMTLDLALPDGDGIAFFDELRSDPKTLRLPVIVVSISARMRRETCRGSAMHVVDWISKPINEARLAWALQQALAARPAAVPRVLHIEDDSDLSSVLAAALRGRAELVTATTLQEAERRLGSESFAAVVLDVGMPDGCGLSLIERIRSIVDPPPPVIILSAREIGNAESLQVAAVMVKSRLAESQIVKSVLEIVGADTPQLRRRAS